MGVMTSSSSGRPTTQADGAAMLLLQGGAIAEACRPVVLHFGLETAVDVLTAATDVEVLDFIEKSADERLADCWARFVRWASVIGNRA